MSSREELGIERIMYFPCIERKDVKDSKEGKRLLVLDTVWRIGLCAIPAIICVPLFVGGTMAIVRDYVTLVQAIFILCGMGLGEPIVTGSVLCLFFGAYFYHHEITHGGAAPFTLRRYA